VKLRPVAAWAAVALIALTANPSYAQRVAGVRPDSSSVEGGLWAESDKAERAAKNSAELDADLELTAYVQKIACRVAPDYCADVRVYVLDRPFFNAAAAPNGYIEVWSGSLLRAKDEAEVAFVIGHEISHFGQNHSVKAWQSAKTKANTAMAVGILASVALSAATFNPATGVSSGDNFSGLIMNVAYLGAMASMFSFSRDQESEADRLGLDRIVKAGYAPSAALDIWRARMDEAQASDFEKIRKGQARTSVFDSHPIEKDRLAALSASIPAGAAGDLGGDALRKMIRPHLGAWLRDDLRRRDYGQTLFTIGRLSEGGADLGLLTFYKGEAYRLRHGDGDLAKARDAYREATAQSDAPVAAWRELGELLRKDGDSAGAKTAYETYLAKAPEADDAWLVRDSLKSLK